MIKTLKRVKTQNVDNSRAILIPKFRKKNTSRRVYAGVSVGGWWVAIKPWWIVVLKVEFNATSSARNFAKLCQHYDGIPKLYF